MKWWMPRRPRILLWLVPLAAVHWALGRPWYTLLLSYAAGFCLAQAMNRYEQRSL